MRKEHILGVLTGPRIKALLRRHNSVIEGWNEYWIKNYGMKSTDRDRLGYKEARFQTLLAQALDESKYDVIVQSYFDRLVRQSCDIFATKPNGTSRYWIEIKSKNVDSGGGYGGINLISEVLCDIGKMKAGKSNSDRIVTWIALWGKAESLKACVRTRPSSTFRIRVSPGQLRRSCASGKTRQFKKKILRQLGNCGSGSVSQALNELRRWIKTNGGTCEVMKMTGRKDEKKRDWANYGILCGIMN